jgi:superfamily II DNA or RNA helicase
MVSGAAARAALAHLILDSDPADRLLGTIELQPHQASAVSRLRKAIREFGGALLCDPVGTGKTYIALALARPNELTLVVAPAVLKEMWERAGQLTHRRVDFMSFESLSRRRAFTGNYGFLIVDEAHHARNPSTQRYETLSRLASRSDMILLTATPVHNHRKDIEALLGLFMGSRAISLKPAELSRCVIRREPATQSVSGIPHAEPVTWFRIGEQNGIVRMLLSLPPPVPPRDGGDGGTLVVNSLIRQWASSDAALRGGLRRRLVRAQSLIASLESGRWPSKSELASWIVDDETIQLSFAEFLSPATAHSNELLNSVRSHAEAVRELLGATAATQADDRRADVIRRLRELHSGRRIVAFSQYADTIDRMFALLSPDGGVAALTGSGARVVGGSISRMDALGRFAPVASGRPRARPANDVSLLLATDLLSEGVNLQDGRVVVHLDLPWTPARMEQRLGRIARLGSPHESVLSYAIRPHVSADNAIRIEAILKDKERTASIVRHEPSVTESIRATLHRWLRSENAPAATTLAAAFTTGFDGFVAACSVDGEQRLIASKEGRISDDADLIAICLAACSGVECPVPQSELESEMDRIESWLDSTRAVGRVRPARPAIRRIDAAVRHAPPHDRARINELAKRARVIASGNLGVFLENELNRLATADDSDSSFLARLSALAEPRFQASAEPNSSTVTSPIRVLIVLRNNNALTQAKER